MAALGKQFKAVQFFLALFLVVIIGGCAAAGKMIDYSGQELQQ